jgi:hypothetical protein
MIATLRDVVLIVAIIAFFSGFSYVSEVIGQFGLSSNLVQFPLYDTLAYSFALFTHFAWQDAVIALVAVLALSLLAGTRQYNALPYRALNNTVLVALVFFAFWLIHSLAYDRAQDYTFGERLSPDNYVKLLIKSGEKWKYDKGFLFLNKHQHLTMVFQTADTYYVLAQFAGNPDPLSTLSHRSNERVYLMPHGFIFAVPKADVATVVTVLRKETYAQADL